MVMVIKAKNLWDAWEKTNNRLFDDPRVQDFHRNAVSMHSFHNTIVSETAECPLRLDHVGYKKTKWSMLQKLYFDPDEFIKWVNRISFYTKTKAGERYVPALTMHFKPRDNRSGACLLGFTLRFCQSRGWEAEVFTRSNESVSRWACDLVYAHVLIRTVGELLGKFEPKDVRVYWVSAEMFQSVLNAPLFLTLVDREDILRDDESDETKWKRAVNKRYWVSFNTEEPKYMSYKTQQRSVNAYWSYHGVNKIPVMKNKDLRLPHVDFESFDNNEFFNRKGFR